MIAKLGSWEIGTNPSKQLGYDAVRIRGVEVADLEVADPEVPPTALELEQAAGEFIARHVLEKDSVFFEG